MVIENRFFKRRDDVHSFLEDNFNVIKVTYFKVSGKYYTEEFYEISSKYENGLWEFSDHFKMYCRDYSGMYAVIEFSDGHPYGYPMMIFAEDRS